MVKNFKKAMITRTVIIVLIIIFFTIIISMGFIYMSIVNSSASSDIMNINYQVIIAGENKNKPVSDVQVTLLISRFDTKTNSIRIFGKVDIPDNPLMSSNNLLNGVSTYTFKNVQVPPEDTNEWTYTIRTERNGRTWVEEGTAFYPGLIYGVTGLFDDSHSITIPSNISTGTLYGYVILDDGNHSIYDGRLSEVNVTLYSCLPYDKTNGIINTGVVNIPNNPQATTDGVNVGMYRFDGLTPGFYNVTIEKDGLVGYRVINFTDNEENNNWINNNLVLLQPHQAQAIYTSTLYPAETATSKPTIISSTQAIATVNPSLNPQPTENVTTSTIPAASPVSTDGFQFLLALMSFMIVSGIILYKIN